MSRPLSTCQLLLASGFMGTLQNPQEFSVSGQVDDDIGRFAPVVGLGKEIQTAIDPLQGDIGKGLCQGFGHGVGQVHQPGIEKPGRPPLQLHGVLGPAPEIGQSQQPLHDRVGVLDPPPWPVERHDLLDGETRRVEFVGQVAIPHALVQDRNQAHPLPVGT
jgi:hypothetical protein